ncbi:collagen-binding protein [Sphingobacterium faecium NBRC 15299]|uniref:TonB-dependent receptor n=1 Tax=Sphingobacterium faecium TaxID=34087 RepID=UPI000D3857F8|nr:TonB-dependent receptor [Sphingobacterium faecium]PTX13597.1 TonB-dependent receptor-like protein [Sphingobacterium faecium]GEM65291.1 collagen-binding protein [Sphingobacterium faecium NBRC 15299]
MLKSISFLFLFVSLTHLSIAQKRYTISGTITDVSSGETLIGATIRLQELPQSSSLSNSYGFYSVSAPEGRYLLTGSYVGYKTYTDTVSLNSDMVLPIAMQSQSTLDEVVVSVNRKNNKNISSPQMGVEKLNMSQINQLPVVLGEQDVLKSITLMPGIKSSGEGNTGFYVRGGGSDQNLILLDEATVYNASHLLGFFSIFNSDAIKDVSIYKGGMPAEYGGRLSSVLDVKMNEGNNKKITVQGGIGMIASRIKVEGPIVKDKGSFMISARRTYADLFLKASSDTTINKSTLYFYDINAKANYRFNDKNAIYLSGYFGKDVLGLQDIFGTNWGNATGTLRFNHVFNNKLFSNTSFIYSNYNYVIEGLDRNDGFKATSKITDLNLKQDFQYYAAYNHNVKFGLQATRHDIAPGDITTTASSSFNNKHVEHRYGYEMAAYASDEWKVNDQLSMLYGLRLSSMLLVGPGTFNSYDAAGNITVSEKYNSGEVVQNYLNLEPRFSVSYMLNEQQSIKASYNRNTQNIHLLTNSTSSSPTDLYVMSSKNIKPEIADQVSMGYFRNFKNNTYELSAELYYKNLQNQIDYKDAAQLLVNQDVESQLLYGVGRAYGAELFLKKKYGKFNGWVGYTLSKTERKFEEINDGKYYPATHDRTHDLSLVAIYKFNEQWTFSSNFVYGTGKAVTYPTGKYSVGGHTTYSYSGRNAYRQPATHRLDIAATYEGKPGKYFQSSWTFGIYNVYAQKDPYRITFKDSKTVPNATEAVQTSIFGVPIPSVTWNFKF